MNSRVCSPKVVSPKCKTTEHSQSWTAYWNPNQEWCFVFFFLRLKRKVLLMKEKKKKEKKEKKGKILLEVSISSYSRKGECIIPLFSLIQDWGELVRVGFDRKQDKRTDLTALNIETTDSSSSKQFMGESVFTLDSKIYKDFLKVIFIFLPKGFYN